MFRVFVFFFFNDTATTEIYTLSLHDALPIFGVVIRLPDDFHVQSRIGGQGVLEAVERLRRIELRVRSEEHTSELQSQSNLVCRLLLEKKKKNKKNHSCSNNKRRNTCTTITQL